MSWYGQGTRVLDITNPYEPIQVAYFRPNGTSSYAPLLYGGLVYVADSGRGIDILRLTDGEFEASAARQEVLRHRCRSRRRTRPSRATSPTR
ncbi:MAG TPA: hypothetical protein VMP42_10380 [Actinomycetota bacterium]|nr:hypothetical protein [Actinomycetota bacterium]